MRIRLIGWESAGLRCPDMRVDLTEGQELPRVSLIQMPNGTGKTTVLSLLRAALTGEALHWGADRVGELKRQGDVGTKGHFLVRLTLDGKPLTFELMFDFLAGTVRYATTAPSMGGVVQEWRPPRDARRFLNQKFVELFVFDGELANRMLKPSESKAEAAIDSLCQLDLLDVVASIAETSWQRVSKDKSAKTATGLTMWRNKEGQIQQRIVEVEKVMADSRTRLTAISREIQSIDEAIGARISANQLLHEEREKVRLEEAECEGQLASAVLEMFQIVRRPQMLDRRFAGALLSLKAHLDKARLPDSTSRQFFIELAQEQLCVCGRPLGEVERTRILAEAGRYLGEDVSGVINALKQDIDTQVSIEDQSALSLPASLETLAQADLRLQQVQTERQRLEAKAMEEAGDDVTGLRERYLALQLQKSDLESALEEIQRPWDLRDDEGTFCLASLKRQLVEARKKIAEITDTVELRDKIDVIKGLSRRAKERARDHLKEVLVSECNERLERVLGADPVKISEIKNCLVLAGQREASVGQTLAVGYTFLATALHRGTHEFPLIVDSPAGPLDDKVRREIGEMVPRLCEQFVGFTISTEREGFLSALERSAGKSVKYLTMFRKSPGTQHLIRGLPKAGVRQTDNGVLVEGREYFVQFTLADELEG